MRTNVVIDDELMSAALKVSGLPSKRAVIEEALRRFVQLKQQSQVRKLKGKIAWDEDLDAMRTDR
jgi:Arc/MetJ family transcription regulator